MKTNNYYRSRVRKNKNPAMALAFVTAAGRNPRAKAAAWVMEYAKRHSGRSAV